MPILVVFAGLYITITWGPSWTSQLADPSCADPRDLELLPADEVTVAASRTASAEGANWGAGNLLDAQTSTVWADDEAGSNATELTFSFAEEVDLQLICVVNGQPSSEQAYANAGKVRQVEVTTDASSGDVPVSPLAVLARDVMQQRQPVQFEEGQTDSCTIRIVGVFPGIAVLVNGSGVQDASQSGVFSTPTGRYAVAEVEFYVAR